MMDDERLDTLLEKASKPCEDAVGAVEGLLIKAIDFFLGDDEKGDDDDTQREDG
jgi:hypothetical protein